MSVAEAETPVRQVGPKHTDGRKPEVDALLETLHALLEKFLSDPATFRLFFMYMGRMHNYSWLNLLTIMADGMRREQELMAMLEATKDKEQRKLIKERLTAFQTGGMVSMGYRGWQNAGRQVRRKASDDNPLGSQAIALLKPVKVPDYNADKSEWRNGKPPLKLIGFEVIRKSFHIQDTDGPEYEATTPKPMEDENDEQAENSRNLCKWISRTALDDFGVPMILRDAKSDRLLLTRTGSADGGALTKEAKIKRDGKEIILPVNTIILKSTSSYAQSASVLVHETAHVFAKDGLENNYHGDIQVRSACEAIAEGVAFVVMTHFGYDCEKASVPYIAGWAKDMNTVKQCLKDIKDTSSAIIEKIEARIEAAKKEA